MMSKHPKHTMSRGATTNLSQKRAIVLWWAQSAPLVEIGLTVTQNLGKARALEALVAVAPLMFMGNLNKTEKKRRKLQTTA